MTLTIRAANTHDVKLLSQIGYISYRAHFAHLWESSSELASYLEKQYSWLAIQNSLKCPKDHWLIAATDTAVGFAKLSWQSKIPEENISGALLSKIYLLPDQVGKKYGEALFEAVLEAVKARGITFLWLEVLENNPRARQFYESFGMKHIKDVVFESTTQSSVVHILGMEI